MPVTLSSNSAALVFKQGVDAILPISLFDGGGVLTGYGSDHVLISRNGGAFAESTNRLVEIGSGSYYWPATAADLDTVGSLAWRIDGFEAACGTIQVIPNTYRSASDSYQVVKQGTPATIPIFIVDQDGVPTSGVDSDHVLLSKNGGSFNVATNRILLIDGGSYYFLLDTSNNETDTLGELAWRLDSFPEVNGSVQIVAYDPADANLAMPNLDAAVSTRSTLAATDVWAAGTRTLTSYGTLIADIWAAATRTLTAINDSTGVTTLLSRIASALNINGGKVDADVKKANGTNVIGSGVPADKWRGG